MRFTRFVTSLVFTGGLALSAAFGCGGSSSGGAKDADMSQLAPAPDLAVYVRVQAGTSDAGQFVPNVESGLTTALTSSGYNLVTSEDGKPDIIAKVIVNAQQEKSVFAVQVNGQTRVTYGVKINASFISAADSSVVDQAMTDFSSSDGTVEQDAINAILVHLSKTGKLTKYAKASKEKAQKAAEEKAAKEKKDADDKVAKEQKAEEDLWQAANVEGCRKPKAANPCDGVKAYIAKYPAGKYTAEARQAVQDGQAEANRMAEEDMWKAAAVDQCTKPTKSYDCQGVEEYLQKYPTGAHAADAKTAMKSSEKAREDLKKKEDLNKKKASRDECIKECRRSYEMYTYFEILVNRCIKTECD